MKEEIRKKYNTWGEFIKDGFSGKKKLNYNIKETSTIKQTYNQGRQEIIKEIDRVYKKEGGIHSWLDLREKLKSQLKMKTKEKIKKVWAVVWKELTLEQQEGVDVFWKKKAAQLKKSQLEERFGARIKIIPCEVNFLKR